MASKSLSLGYKHNSNRRVNRTKVRGKRLRTWKIFHKCRRKRTRNK